ncbi:phosphotransferase [Klebsiella variicola subsp. variicola]|nr:phosphotransferase [Klebsiella variicola subsp. variicola]
MKVIPARLGGNPIRLATLSQFLDGELLAKVPSKPIQMKKLGQALAKMDVALIDFDHKGAHRELAWDLAQSANCRFLLPNRTVTASEARWKLVRNGLDFFVDEVQPRMRDLRSQVIHADFNPFNILMDKNHFENVTGILDFGDMVYSQLVNNVAVAATYQVSSHSHLSSVIDLITAYHDILPLKPEEIDLLYDLIITRLCMAVTITEHRARQHPQNSKYILKNTASAWRGLERLSTISRKEATAMFRIACNFPSWR